MKNAKNPDNPSKAEKINMVSSLIATFPVLKSNDTENGYEHFFDPKSFTGHLEYYIRSRCSWDPDIVTKVHSRKSDIHLLDDEDAKSFMRQNKPTITNQNILMNALEKTRQQWQQWIKKRKSRHYNHFDDISKITWFERWDCKGVYFNCKTKKRFCFWMEYASKNIIALAHQQLKEKMNACNVCLII